MESDFIYAGASNGASHRLLLLHGWGADADDLVPLGQQLSKGLLGIKLELVSLRAPQKHPEGLGRQWYGLFPPQWAEVPAAINDLQKRIEFFSRSSVPLEKTVILGFSQGGAMALAGGLALPVAGVIACSAYPHPNWSPPKQSPPIFLTHGLNDEIVPYEALTRLKSALINNELQVDIKVFEGGHEIPLELIPIIQSVLQKWLV